MNEKTNANQSFVFTYVNNVADYIAFTLVLATRPRILALRFFAYFAVILIALMSSGRVWTWEIGWQEPLVAAGIAILIVVAHWLVSLIAGLIFHYTKKQSRGPFTVQIAAEGVQVSSTIGQMALQWDAFERQNASSKRLYLRLKSGGILAFPRRGLSDQSQWDQLIIFVATRLPST